MGRFGGWKHVEIVDDEGIRRDAIAPVIVSASRATDIPAFFGEWFLHRLMRGHVVWKNPWNRQGVFVSFAHTRVFVFWSKNPRPFMTSLSRIGEMGYSYYFLFTLNDYESEGLEPGIPELAERVKTFLELSRMVGAGRVVWRYDPLLLSDSLGVDDLLSRVEKIGFRLAGHTQRLVISFIDIHKYPTVRRNLEKSGFSDIREFSDQEIDLFCSGLAEMNAEWGLSLSACGEPRDLSPYGISRGQCISGHLMRDEFRHDQALMQFLGEPDNKKGERPGRMPFWHLKDPGQRGACGCIASKDIGQYSTCMHLCRYCYANASAQAVEENARKHQALSQRGIFPESICGN